MSIRSLDHSAATLVAILVLCGAAMSQPQMSHAQTGPNTSYAHFAGLADVSNVQVRFTYVGALADDRPEPLILTTPGKAADAATFRAFQRPGLVYPLPEGTVVSRTISTAEMRQVIVNLGSLPAVVGGSVASTPWIAVALLDKGGPPKVAEAVLGKTDAVALVGQMSNALATNASALGALHSLACSAGSLGPQRPTEVTASVEVVLSGARLDRGTGNYVATATLRNTGAAPIAAPLSLVFRFAEAGVSLVNASGLTCGTSPPGLAYLSTTPAGGSLAPGARLTLELSFKNPDRRSMAATTKVLAGPGAR